MAVKLTAIERKTVRLAMQHMTFREIGRAMNTSEQVVKNRMLQVYEKTGASDRMELQALVTAHPEWIGGKGCGECGQLIEDSEP